MSSDHKNGRVKKPLREVLEAFHKRDPEGVVKLLKDDEYFVAAMEGLKLRLDDGEEDALKLYFQLVGMTKGLPGELRKFLDSVDCKDETEARTLISMARDSLKMSLEEQLAECFKFINEHRATLGLPPVELPERRMKQLEDGASLHDGSGDPIPVEVRAEPVPEKPRLTLKEHQARIRERMASQS